MNFFAFSSSNFQEVNMTNLFIILLLSALVLMAGCVPNQNVSSLDVIPARAVTPIMAKSPEEFSMNEEGEKWYESYWERFKASSKFSEKVNDFYLRSSELLLKTGKNAVCSPLNLYIALAALAETAGGETQSQILSVLGAKNMDELRESVKALSATNNEDNPYFKSLLATSVWLNSDVKYKNELLNFLADEYLVSTFSGKPGTPEMNKSLQDWINNNTGNLLKEYAGGIVTEPELVMSLVSTIYYKNTWNSVFDEKDNVTAVFHGDIEKECEMMKKSSYNTYYFGDKFGAVSLEMAQGHSMVFFLPDEGVDADALLMDRQVSDLLNHRSSYANRKYLKINMQLPKFNVHSGIKLKDALSSLGIKDAFSPELADFTPLTDTEGVFLSQAEHAALVKIDENGVEGAAYTVLGLCGSSMPPEEEMDFVIDRPFYFVIASPDGSILFAGIVRDI